MKPVVRADRSATGWMLSLRVGEHTHKEAVGRDRQQAEIALHRLAAAVEDGVYWPRPTIRRDPTIQRVSTRS